MSTAHNVDYTAAMEVCSNIKDTLTTISLPERYSGVSSAILKAAVGENSKILPTSKLLQVTPLCCKITYNIINRWE